MCHIGQLGPEVAAVSLEDHRRQGDPQDDGGVGGENIGTDSIYNYRRVDDRISTGGQPTAEQLKAAAAEGFAVVVNLATLSPRYSLEDEAGLVGSLGMTYCHIPVEWDHGNDGGGAV